MCNADWEDIVDLTFTQSAAEKRRSPSSPAVASALIFKECPKSRPAGARVERSHTPMVLSADPVKRKEPKEAMDVTES